MPGTLRQISRSHVISRFRPDLLPSLHKVTQMRHTFRLKTLILSFLELLVDDMLIFICHLGDPWSYWKTQKTAPKLVSYFQESDTNTKIWSASRKRVVFSKMHFRRY